MLRRTTKNLFINFGNGQAIGQIEDIGNYGVFFKHAAVQVRITSSNFAKGKTFSMSIPTFLEGKGAHKTKKQILEILNTSLQQRKPVIVKYQLHAFGLPWNGFTCTISSYRPIMYISDVELIDIMEVHNNEFLGNTSTGLSVNLASIV